MVFSFFKKDPKAGTKPRKGKPGGGRSTAPGQNRSGAPKPLSKPLAQPVNRGLGNTSTPSSAAPAGAIAATNAAAKELARTQAMATAAKIDQIESEMARDFLRPPGAKAANTLSPAEALEAATLSTPTASVMPNTSVANNTTVNGALTRANGNTTVAGTPDDDEFGSEDLEGAAAAIEISTGTSSSAIEEGAILFANGQAEMAEAVLRAAIEADDLGAQKVVAWLMLFELLNQRGDHAAFEKLSTIFAMRFQSSPPAWIDYAGLQQDAAARAAAPAVPAVTLPASLDGNLVKQLDELRAKAASSQSLLLDVSGVRSVDLAGAEMLLRVINAFKKSTQELTVQGVEQLLMPLRAAVEAGRRDASDAAWLLLLEVLRLLGRQDDFDETGIQYCITFELSPPSWELPPANIKARAASAARPAAGPTLNPFDWRGVIAAEGEQLFNRLLAESRTNKHLSIECMQLRRMAFSSGSSLLTHIMKLRQTGASVEFRNVNALINALFQLLGISALSTVLQRRG